MSIKAETKEDVVKRLGRSPDKGDAVVMCWSRGPATMLGQIIPRDQRDIGSPMRAVGSSVSTDSNSTKPAPSSLKLPAQS